MKPQSCKNKGRILQKKVCQSILDAFPDLKEDDVGSCGMGQNGEDIKLSPKARDLIPVSIECKNQEKLNIWDAIDQCEKNTPSGITPVVIFKRNRTETYSVLKWDSLLDLYSNKNAPEEETDERVKRIRTLVTELHELVNNVNTLDSEKM